MNTPSFKQFRIVSTTLILLLVLFSSSCVVTFNNPLTTSNEIDNRLIGKWKAKEDDKTIFNFSTNSSGETQVEIADETKREGLFTASSIKLGKFNYLSLRMKDEDEEKDFYLVTKYEIADKKLSVWLPDRSKFLEFIEKGKLKGEERPNRELNIDSSSNELKQFFETLEDGEFFELLGEFDKQ